MQSVCITLQTAHFSITNTSIDIYICTWPVAAEYNHSEAVDVSGLGAEPVASVVKPFCHI